MTIDKAIDLIETLMNEQAAQTDPDTRTALNLALEALERIQYERQHTHVFINTPLPSEED